MASSLIQPQAQTSQTRAYTQGQTHQPEQIDSQQPPANFPPAPATGTAKQNPTTATTTISLTPSRHLYIHLHPITNPLHANTESVNLDETTLRLHLLSAASSYLGDTGAAIPVDILSVRSAVDSQPRIVIRVPREDGPAFLAAVTSWVGGVSGSTAGADVVGYVVRAKSEWLAELAGSVDGDVEGLFDFTR